MHAELKVDDQCASVNVQNQGQLTLSLASVLGLISFVLLIAVIVASIYISYRLCKRDKKVTRYHVDYIDNHARDCVLRCPICMLMQASSSSSL